MSEAIRIKSDAGGFSLISSIYELGGAPEENQRRLVKAIRTVEGSSDWVVFPRVGTSARELAQILANDLGVVVIDIIAQENMETVDTSQQYSPIRIKN